MTTPVGERDALLQVTSPRFVGAGSLTVSGMVVIFRRTTTSTPPALPSATATFTFASGVTSGLTNSWSVGLPPLTDGPYLWSSNVYFGSSSPTFAITTGLWATVQAMYDAGPVAQAEADATAANNALAIIASDNMLSKGEKPAVILDWNTILGEFNPIQVQADNLGVSHTSFDSAYVTLYNYLGSINTAPAWTDVTVDTPIVGSTFKTNFLNYYNAKISVLNAMSAAAATKANWVGGISGRPADSALLNSYIAIGVDGTLSGAGGGQVTLTGMGQKTFRVVAQGGSSTTTPVGAGIYKDGTLQQGETRSYTVVTITRATGAIYSATTFDVYGAGAVTSGRDAGTMAAHLNSFGSGTHIIVVYSADEPQLNRLTAGLDAAMYRHGASRMVYGSPNFQYRAAYILVGIAGCGEGNGAEAYQGSVANDTNAWCDLGFNVLNGVLTGVSSSFKPKSLTDYGYTGDMNATVGAPSGTNVAGVLSDTLVSQAAAGNTASTTLNAPPTLSSISNVSATNVYKPAVTIATKTPGITNGIGPFTFDWRIENLLVGDVDITHNISSVTNTNDKDTITAISQVTGGAPSQDRVTVTATDSKGRVTPIQQFIVNASC